MNIKTILKKLLGRETPPAHLPYIATPPANQPHQQHNNTNTDISYTETETDIHRIAGTSIAFGNQKIVQVDENNQARHLSQTQSHIVGSGKLVSSIEPKEVAGQILPGITGICRYCQAETTQAYEANLISVQEAQIKSLYDTSSASQCDICGTNTCCRHCRPIQMPDGSTQALCVDCQKQLKWQIFKHKMSSFLLSPFMENENPTEE